MIKSPPPPFFLSRLILSLISGDGSHQFGSQHDAVHPMADPGPPGDQHRPDHGDVPVDPNGHHADATPPTYKHPDAEVCNIIPYVN